MLKIPAILICFLFCAYHVGAQKIYFSDTSNKWRIVNSNCGGDDHPPGVGIVHYYPADTTINNISYKILSAGPTFVREDTVAGKVFAICPGWPTYDTTEELLYNYNLQVGDTFICKFAAHVVDSIDTVSVNSRVYKIWHLRSLALDTYVDYDIVEGLGCINGPVYPLYPYFFEECVFECCFENNGTSPAFGHSIGTFYWEYYHFGQHGIVHYDNTSSCDEGFSLAVGNVNIARYGSTIAPNPIQPNSRIILPYAVSSGILYLTNGFGQIVNRTSFNNKKELSIGNVITLPGFYCYKVVDLQSGNVFCGKFVY